MNEREYTDSVRNIRRNIDKVVYICAADARLQQSFCTEFIVRGFQVSLLPDQSGLDAMINMRRPDLVVVNVDAVSSISKAVNLLDRIKGHHLAISSFFIVPREVSAEIVSRLIRSGATMAYSSPASAVELVQEAEKCLQERVGSRVRVDANHEPVRAPGFVALTYRERQILQLVVEGYSNKEIGIRLGISYRTVEVHRRRGIGKVGAKNTAELVRLSVEG